VTYDTHDDTGKEGGESMTVWARIALAIVSVLLLVIGINNVPEPEYYDEFWFGGALAFGLASLLPWPSN